MSCTQGRGGGGRSPVRPAAVRSCVYVRAYALLVLIFPLAVSCNQRLSVIYFSRHPSVSLCHSRLLSIL